MRSPLAFRPSLRKRTPAPPPLLETAGFGSNPGQLLMFSHAPEGLAPGAPLVVVLHGCTQTAAGYDGGAGWSELAESLGFVVLAPQQTGANNMNRCFNWFEPGDTARDQGEAASIRQMIGQAITTYDLDPDRVFITGLSAGGAMTAAMLAAYPEVFAGGAIIAGLPYGVAGNVQQAMGAMHRPPLHEARAWGDLVRGASNHAGPWPKVSVWHGDQDMTVSSTNAGALVAQWADVHGLETADGVHDRVDGYPRQTWRDRHGDVVLERYVITGMGHGAPVRCGADEGDCGAAGAFILETGISSSYRIAQFWGLADAQRRPARREVEINLEASPPPNLTKIKRAGFDPQTVITDALRAAGLMK